MRQAASRTLLALLVICGTRVDGRSNPAGWEEQTQEVSQEVDEARRRLGLVDDKTPIERTLSDWGFKRIFGAYEMPFSVPEPGYFQTARLRITPLESELDQTVYPDGFINQLKQTPAHLKLTFYWDINPKRQHSLTVPIRASAREDGFRDPVALLAELLPMVSQEKIDPARVLAHRQVADRLRLEERRIGAIKQQWAEVLAELEPRGFKAAAPADPFSEIRKDQLGVALDLIPLKKFGGVVIYFRDPSTGLTALKDYDSILDFKADIKARGPSWVAEAR